MLQELDLRILHFINRDLSNPFFDCFFPLWTDFQQSPLFYFLLSVLMGSLIYKKMWKAIFIILICTVGAFTADKINSELIKPFFERPRPTDVILRIPHQGSFSFPSSHAVDVFFIATFLGLHFPRWKKFLFSWAFFTAFSRVYCGVHYPGDIIGGAFWGIVFGLIIFNLLRGIQMKNKFITFFLLMIFSGQAFAFTFEDPTNSKPFFSWAWEDELRPTFKKSIDFTNLTILASGIASSLVVKAYDKKINSYNQAHGSQWMSDLSAERIGKLGNGVAGAIIAGTQLIFDQENGVNTTKAILLTSLSHVTISSMVRRNRPGNRADFLPFPSSFPSGHASSSFAVAGSLAYSYGWYGGIPGYITATAISLSRVRENRHWASDIVGGAFLGTFWARASFEDKDSEKTEFVIVPVPIDDGMMVSGTYDF